MGVAMSMRMSMRMVMRMSMRMIILRQIFRHHLRPMIVNTLNIDIPSLDPTVALHHLLNAAVELICYFWDAALQVLNETSERGGWVWKGTQKTCRHHITSATGETVEVYMGSHYSREGDKGQHLHATNKAIPATMTKKQQK